MVLDYFIIQFLQLILTEKLRLKDELRNLVLTSKSKIIWKLDFVSERFSPKVEGFSQNRVCIF